MNSSQTPSVPMVHPAVPAWLFTVCFLVFFMVVLGGVTRLTHSGLSMVEWRPITGWLPPLTDEEWARTFAAYQTSPEFQKVNPDMDVDGFKGIFWLEFLHRLLGRGVGVVFFVPLVFFWARGMLSQPGLKAKCTIMFILGGLQGGLGWYMVKSGLIDHPDVSQYRLAAHLSLALVIYAFILWVALGLTRAGFIPTSARGERGARGPLFRRTAWLLFLIAVTIVSGAFVAGLDAGFMFNTFPLMDGQLVPDEAFARAPFYLNFFEDAPTAQFDHRVLALVTLALVLIHWITGRRTATAPDLRRALDLFALAVLLQVGLGIATLLLIVPVSLGAAHQGGAVVLLTAGLWCLNRAAARD